MFLVIYNASCRNANQKPAVNVWFLEQEKGNALTNIIYSKVLVQSLLVFII
jgi:hypothetical protein